MRLHRGLAGVVMAALGLAGCGGSDGVDGVVDGGVVAPPAAASSWTTLGNRDALSGPLDAPTQAGKGRWIDYDPPALYPGRATQAVQHLTMPDGIQIAVYVTLPADASGQAIDGRFPTVLSFTGYNTDSGTGGSRGVFIQQGYAMVLVDARGTGSSTGQWDAFGPAEQADMTPVLDWVVQQPWSDGRIGSFGGSYIGITALQAASTGHPAIKAVFAEIAAGDWYRDLVFTGGQFSSLFMPGWLGLVTAGSVQQPDKFTDPDFNAALVQRLIALPSSFQARLLLGGLTGDPELVYDGPFSAARSPNERVAGIRAPTFLTGGLYDIFQRGVPLNYERIKAQAPVKMLIGPWIHTGYGNGLPADGVPPVDRLALLWFDHYVKGLRVGAEALPNVTQFVAGHGHYVTAADWPHPQARAQTWYLRGDRSVSQTPPLADEARNVTLQHPLNGLCTSNTSQWSSGFSNAVPVSCQYNNELAYRTELVYETAPLAEDLYINGPIQADLWVSTTALDAGIAVRVDDMEGDSGTQIAAGLQTISLRAVDASRSRYLDGQMIQPWHSYTRESQQRVSPGEAVMVSVEIFPTSALIARGHALRLTIGTSDLTRAIMPGPLLVPSALGLMTIYSDAARPSRIVVPAVPVDQLR